jgi:hypothetical protein
MAGSRHAATGHAGMTRPLLLTLYVVAMVVVIVGVDVMLFRGHQLGDG